MAGTFAGRETLGTQNVPQVRSLIVFKKSNAAGVSIRIYGAISMRRRGF